MNDIARALRVTRKIESDMVGINTAFLPFRGDAFDIFKQSVYSRENGRDSLRQYLQAKTIHITRICRRRVEKERHALTMRVMLLQVLYDDKSLGPD